MDFIHCNQCYIQPGHPQNKSFLLSNCGHIFCCDCANTNESKCKTCLNDCKYLSIDNDMPDGLKQFFSNPVKELKKAVKILLIQNIHCKIYMEEYVPKLECKYAQAKILIENSKSDFEKMKRAVQNKEAEVQLLRSQIEKLKAELEDNRKRSASFQHQQLGSYSPTLPSSPSSFGSAQEGFFTPKVDLSGTKLGPSSFDLMNRHSGSAFMSHLTPSPPSRERKKLTAMELLFKNKEAAVRNSQGDRTPRTPVMRSNQTFNMSINVTPPNGYNSDDSQGPFSDAKRMPSPLELKMRQYQRPASEINHFQKRNSLAMSSASSQSSFKSKYFHRSAHDLGRKFFQP